MDRLTKILAITNLFPNCAESNRGIFNRQQFRQLNRLAQLKVVAPLPLIKYPLKMVPEHETIDAMDIFHPRYVVIPKTLRSLYGFTFFYGILGTIRRIKKDFSFDVIFATWAYPDAFGAYLAARLLKKPLVIKVHGSDINVMGKFALRRRMMMAAFGYARKIIAVSGPLKQKIVEWGVPEEKVVVIPNGVDTGLFHPMDRKECRQRLSLPPKDKIILYVGNLEPIKGPDVLIEAFKEMSGNVRLIMIGQGSMEKELKEKAKQLRVEERVLFLGPKLHEELPVWFNAANVFCLPSREEGCPNVILEALACRIPIVATRVGGIPSLIPLEENGTLVEPGNVGALIQALGDRFRSTAPDSPTVVKNWLENAGKVFQILQDSAGQKSDIAL